MDAFLAILVKLGPAATGWALVGVFVYFVATGRLITRSQADAISTVNAERVRESREEANNWRSAVQTLSESNAILIRQNSELTELARAGAAVMHALPAVPEVGR